MKKTLTISSMALACLALAVGLTLAPKVRAASGGSSQTAQSIMVDGVFNSDSYEISGETVWSFNRNCAEGHYSAGAGVWNGQNPTCTGGGPGGVNCALANRPSTPPAPPADEHGPNSIEHHAQQDRCTFFCGGPLDTWNYTQDETVNGVNGSGHWTFTYNYSVTSDTVDPQTCYDCSQSAGGAVEVKFCGFVAGESFLKKSGGNSGWDKKYSFTLTEPDPITGLPVSRVTGVMATLQRSTDLGTTWFDVQGPVALDTSNIVSCGKPTDSVGGTFCDALGPVVDYVYNANAGFGGNVAAVGSFLHSSIPGHLAPDTTGNIMNGVFPSPDNFAGNNNDLCNYSQTAPFFVDFTGIADPGMYRIHITGTVKGNGAVSDQQFSVSGTGGNVTVNGCDNPDCPIPPSCPE